MMEDLLREQAKFLAERSAPAARVSRVSRAKAPPPEKPSTAEGPPRECVRDPTRLKIRTFWTSLAVDGVECVVPSRTCKV